jgi:calpain-15
MTLENMQQYFRLLNICKVKNWDEVRVKGKFVRVEDMSDESLEVYLSKWYYQFEITEKLAKDKPDREIIITLH